MNSALIDLLYEIDTLLKRVNMNLYFGAVVKYQVSDTETKLAVVVRVHTNTCVNLVVEDENVIRTSVVLGQEVGQFRFCAE